MDQTRTMLTLSGRVINEVFSFIIFTILDILDFVLCYIFKVADFLVESEWKPCYCSSAKEVITSSGKILICEQGGSRIVRLSSSKLQLEDISDTLYTRPSVMSELKKLKLETAMVNKSSCEKMIKKGGTIRRSRFRVNATIVEMLQGKKVVGKQLNSSSPRWSDCECNTCASWTTSCKDALFVNVDGAKENVQEDVIFIHGFISSSAFWTETLFPNFSKSAKSKYRFIAFDLLGFGRSPKPNDSLYTLGEHLEMIEKSVLEAHKVKSFHIVAHSLGCILALAIAVKYPGSVKSLTLLAPPYFPVPKGESPTQYMMRRLAPRRIWPLISFGASVGCYYEHISRTACVLIARNHRLWEFLTKLVTRNRIRTYLMEGFWCHTHNAAWHTLHNILCGTATKVEAYLDAVKNRLKCDVTIYHGKNDELIPLECSYNVRSKIPRANVKVVDSKDHITIVVGRQEVFAAELEEIWRNSSC